MASPKEEYLKEFEEQLLLGIAVKVLPGTPDHLTNNIAIGVLGAQVARRLYAIEERLELLERHMERSEE